MLLSLAVGTNGGESKGRRRGKGQRYAAVSQEGGSGPWPWRAPVLQLCPRGIYGSTDFTLCLCRAAPWERLCVRTAVSRLGFPIKVFLVFLGNKAVMF